MVLEKARQDIDFSRLEVADTPISHYTKAGANGPVVVIAHGFAGSQQMMQGYALPLARAGYRVYAFDFLGHGRHTLPMSGDVSSVDGTTRLLVEQTNKVIDAVTQDDEAIALLGHSMATDILVRVAAERSDVGPIVLISAFSQEIDASKPDELLLLAGEWEPGLRAFARTSLQMVDAAAVEGETALNSSVTRRMVAAPFSEHVSILQSRVARSEALAWIDKAYRRKSDISILPTGWAILGLLAGLVVIFHPVSKLLTKRAYAVMTLTIGQTALVLLVPMFVAPILAVTLNTDILPVLVADYLVLHLLVFGVVQLAILRIFRISVGPPVLPALGVLLLACAVFGFALDRYAANFWPTGGRLWIIAAMAIGAVPYMVADSVLTVSQTFLRRFLTRLSFLTSLGIAVALDFEALFFLLLIAPVLVLFYIVFGIMGRQTATRVGPLSSGLALGLVLAWALGVSFPLFQV
ncbi:alpha/beta hydrolase [Sulfitobacter guttiformis]|uniref:Serine aminopeptidase S33 family n=1 Tax=Sulfitobacter guttiformis TaxID=74349 RepID=A0A420DU99_9RHOB|nr:alpha/beta fold hydrolase [Sulfitobacter guttiformis]KIN71273.1 Dienelactone hydrolase [Sulfitobacter guttiformis KCTC 32187]RKE97729.1 serine aminopeptidase S33 family [Sulfitobacter guttiformis]